LKVVEQTCHLISSASVVLNLGENNLSGAIPSELGNLSRLEQLRVQENSLNGQLPSEIFNLERTGKKEHVVLSLRFRNGHGLTYHIYIVIAEHLRLQDNSFTGSIPSLGMLPRLLDLYLGGNMLDSTLPTQFGSLSELEILNLDGNRIDSTIPTEVGHMTRLSKSAVLDLLNYLICLKVHDDISYLFRR
jgi:Leucine-rich repeat (LRR) protein